MKKIIFISIIILIIYYFLTLLTSFILISKHVADNNDLALNKYLNTSNISINFYNEIFNLKEVFINDSNINIKNNSSTLSGELSPDFFEKLFTNLAINISKDFSKANIMLYFYYNSKEIGNYINKSLANLGNYNFEKYILEVNKKKDKKKNIKNTKIETNIIEKEEEKIDEKQNILSKLINKYKYTEYFFIITPIHFKMKVRHQDILFEVIFRFNGFRWKINNISIPYNQLIATKINFIN